MRTKEQIFKANVEKVDGLNFDDIPKKLHMVIMDSMDDFMNQSISEKHTTGDFCKCISRIGVSGPMYGPWTCKSCRKLIVNLH